MCVKKTTTGGYDGKGQVVIRNEEGLASAIELVEQAECILEAWVPFEKKKSPLLLYDLLAERQRCSR
ncbi:hypothetical protein GCM10020331_016150 [Ectobacillus funiculus]